jgi:hypothetical protein
MDELTAGDFREAARRTGANVGVGFDGGRFGAWVMDDDGFNVEVVDDTPRGALERAVARWFELRGEAY